MGARPPVDLPLIRSKCSRKHPECDGQCDSAKCGWTEGADQGDVTFGDAKSLYDGAIDEEDWSMRAQTPPGAIHTDATENPCCI